MVKSNILIVEDNVIAAHILKTYCQRINATVDHAPSCAAACDFLLHEKYELIFMDLGLPDGEGITVIQRIRAIKNKNQHTPIVVVSAHVDEISAVECWKVGASDVIRKPLLGERIEQIFKKFLGDY